MRRCVVCTGSPVTGRQRSCVGRRGPAPCERRAYQHFRRQCAPLRRQAWGKSGAVRDAAAPRPLGAVLWGSHGGQGGSMLLYSSGWGRGLGLSVGGPVYSGQGVRGAVPGAFAGVCQHTTGALYPSCDAVLHGCTALSLQRLASNTHSPEMGCTCTFTPLCLAAVAFVVSAPPRMVALLCCRLCMAWLALGWGVVGAGVKSAHHMLTAGRAALCSTITAFPHSA